ncbi:MAG: hypothetical protein AB2690_17360 [Candidatus Thiodiazotropha endolucinida]
MAEVVQFHSKAELSARENLDQFIAFCRDELSLYDWGELKWVSPHFKKGGIVFTRFRKDKNPYPSAENAMREPFLSFAKAFVRYKQSIRETTSIANFQMQAIRLVHDALEETSSDLPPDVLALDGVTQLKAAQLLVERYENAAVRNKIGNALITFYNFLLDKAFVPSLPRWKNPHPRQKAIAEQTSPEAMEWQDNRRLPLHVITSLADCFARAESEQDLYWSSVSVLLMFAPNRVGELAGLTTDCLRPSEGHLYVQWWGKKGFGPTLKKVPKVMEPAVRLAVDRLTDIGAAARLAAEQAYTNRGKFPAHLLPAGLPDSAQNQRLNSHEVAAAVGARINPKNKVDSGRAWHQLKGKWLDSARDENGDLSYSSLAHLSLKKYSPKKWNPDTDAPPTAGDTERPIWESLCISLDRQFHADFDPVPLSWVTVDANTLNDQLGGRKSARNSTRTIFERFGKTDPDGNPIRLTTHQLRVWISTVAERAGMDDYTLAVWAARADPKHNAHYDLRTPEERAESKRALMVPEGADGQISSLAEVSTAPTAIQLIRMGQPVALIELGTQMVGAAQATLYGWCTTDWAQNPCSKSHQCLVCKELKCVKGDDVKLANLKRHAEFLERQLEVARKAVEEDEYGAEVWFEHSKKEFAEASRTIQRLTWELTHAKTFVAILEDPSVPDGSVISIPPSHDVDPAIRALEAREANTQRRETDEIPSDSVLALIGVARVED